ncbi:MAG TPA: glycosyltransferase [Vicinamibacterales bacterium]|jgi:sugar transferase (PEP-CTERM/EpsH1 system associated)
MRILWLKSDLLLPLDKGGKLRTWHLLRHLARRHDVTYFSFRDPGQPMADMEGMREVATSIGTIARADPSKGSLRFYADAARHVVGRLPYAVAKYRSRDFRQGLDELLDEEIFDLIVCDFLFPAVNLRDQLPCPAVLFTHNVESEIWRRHAETTSSRLRQWLYRTQYRRMLRYEARTLARFDGVLAVSEADRRAFEQLYPGAIAGSVHVVPTGVDTEYFAPSPAQSAGPHLTFTGSMDWLPNEDAMSYFCEQILPLIRAEIPDVTLSIVGRAPTPAVRRLANDRGIHVTGRVDDVRPFVRDAAVYVVPLRIGGGTRLKIFEAMAMGKAVVSTTVGAEGLPVADKEHLTLADEPSRFASAVVELIRDETRRKQLGDAARALVVNRYDWSAVAGSLEHALLRFAAGRVQNINPLPTWPRVDVNARPYGRSL